MTQTAWLFGRQMALGIAGGVLILATLTAHAIQFKRLTSVDGLFQGVVNAIAQDHDGYIWLGAQHGLARFDGFEFRAFQHSPDDPLTIPGDLIRALLVDREGRLWVGSETGGLARYDASIQGFVRYSLLESPDTSAARSPGVRALVQDSTGNIWIATDDDGLFRLHPHTGQIASYRAQDATLTSAQIKALHIDPFDVLWVGTHGGGLLRFDPVTQKFMQVDQIGRNARISEIAGGGAQPLWVGTYEDGIFQLDVATGAARHFKHDAANPRSTISDSIRALFQDSNHRIWIGHEVDGLERYDGDAGFVSFRNNPVNARSLLDDQVSAIFQDQGGVIWVGTQLGVSRWNPNVDGFAAYSQYDRPPNQLSNNWVAGFAEHDPGTVWVATLGGGLNLFDLGSGEVSVFRHDVSEPNGLSDDRVLAVMQDRAGELWAGTRASGLDRYNPDTGRWRNYRNNPGDPASLSENGVTSILQDSAGRMWVGTFSGGLNRYDPVTDGFVHFRHNPDDAASLCTDRILSVFEDSAGTLWLGTFDGGLCRMDSRSESFAKFGHDPRDAMSLSNDRAWNVTEDTHGNLWVGTAENGVNVWLARDRQSATQRFLRLGVADGLASPVVYGLAADGRGRVWISSNLGITRATLDENGEGLRDIEHFNSSDGLSGDEFNFAAVMRGSNGRMYFGGTSGFTSFHPEEIGTNTHSPNIVLTRFTKLNREIPIVNAKPVELEHTDNLITLEYAALDFTSPRENVYLHKLEGFDGSWVDDGNRHRATYTNLAAGDYTFRVRAANSDDVWSTNELSIPIRVLPAPWATSWAYALYALVAAGLVLLAHRSWSRRLAVARQIETVNRSLVIEVQERKAKEVELERSVQTAQRYLDVVEVIILALDSSGVVTMVNQKGARVLNMPESEIVGRDFCESFVPRAETEKVRNGLADVEQYAYSESHLCRKNGTDRLIAWHTIRLPATRDEPGGVLMSGADVTQMRNLEVQLRNAQKMEALGTLARGIAHDFNNILSVILGYAELTKTKLDDVHAAQAYLEKIGASVSRAREIVQGILTFGRVTNVQPKPANVTHVLAEAMQLVRPILPANIVLHEFLDEDCGPVLADPSQLIQVVLNLCTNAIQSMAEYGGELRVSVEVVVLDTEAARSLVVLEPGPHVMLAVADDGQGMDDYTQSRIFEPFYTTRGPGGGTGLGLSVVHGIVSHLKGAIRVESALGAGTRFEIYLPCRTELRVAYVEDEHSGSENLAGDETILLVDDEVEVAATSREALAALGYKVLVAADAEEATTILETHQGRIDVLVTDQTMPGLRGREFAARFKSAQPGTPVLLISGVDQPRSVHIDGFLQKPFSQNQLAGEIRRLLASALPVGSGTG